MKINLLVILAIFAPPLTLVTAPSVIGANDVDSLLQAQRKSYDQSDFTRAVEIGEQISKTSPENFQARYLEAGGLVQLGRLDDALEQYKKCEPYAKTPELKRSIDNAISQLRSTMQAAQPVGHTAFKFSQVSTPDSKDAAVNEKIKELVAERDKRIAEINARGQVDIQKIRADRAAYNQTVINDVRHNYNGEISAAMRPYDQDVNKKIAELGFVYNNEVLEVSRFYDKQILELKKRGSLSGVHSYVPSSSN